MPYIKQTDRPALDESINELKDAIHTTGELNYALTRLTAGFILRHGLKYETLCSLIGTLQLVVGELQRRVVNPFEDDKILENEDVEEYAELAYVQRLKRS